MSGEKKACRVSYWSELTDAERIERMRQEVKCLKERADGQNDSITQLLVHLHDGGTVVVPIDKEQRQYSLSCRNIGNAPGDGDDVYF